MIQIATESGLMPKPVKRRRILIGPAERVEVIVDFRHVAGKRVELVSVAAAKAPRATRLEDLRRPADAVPGRQAGRRTRPASRPTLRPLPAWVERAPPSPTQTWESRSAPACPDLADQRQDLRPGVARSPGRARHDRDLAAHNATAVAHVIHIHATDWYMLSRNGKPPPPWEDCLKETFLLDPGDGSSSPATSATTPAST